MNYTVVDVFTTTPLKGNPVGVVLDASSLTGEQMQDIARWTNLSETTFVVPKTNEEADYKLRIFTTVCELPFAGHPSLGTAYALLKKGLVDTTKPVLIQESERGLVPIRVENTTGIPTLAFGIDGLAATPVHAGTLEPYLPGLTIVGQPLMVDAGPFWVVVEVSNSREELLSFAPDTTRILGLSHELSASGICVFTRIDSTSNDIEMRTFCPAAGPEEDPVCGSGNAAVAYYRNLKAPYLSNQGRAVNRDGKITVDYDEERIWIGGSCCSVINGTLSI